MSEIFFGFIVQVLWEVINGECNMAKFSATMRLLSLLGGAGDDLDDKGSNLELINK